jgi:hypothetical protein
MGGHVEIFAAAAQANATFYADLTNPQTLNKYQYCVNNPLRYTDPSGHQEQDDKASVTTWIQSLIRQILKGKDQYPEEPERRGALSLDADEVNKRATQAAGEAAKARADLLKMTGLDFGTLDLIESAVNNDAQGVAFGAILFAANSATGPGKSVLIGENMTSRVIPVATEIGAKTYRPTSKIAENWLRNNARWIATQIYNGNRIFDIGMDVNRAASKYYAKEVEILMKKGFDRVRVGTVEIGKKSFELYEWVKK